MERAHHVASLSANLFKLQQETKLCDIELQCSDGKVHAHSAVLSSSSGVLHSMITGINMKLPLQAYSRNTVQQMVEYLYTGGIDYDTVEDPVSLYKLLKYIGIGPKAEKLRKIISGTEAGKMILEEESNENSGDFNELTPGAAVTLSQELFSSLVKYGSASLSSETQVKQETEKEEKYPTVFEGDEDNVGEVDDGGSGEENKTVGKAPLKLTVPKIKELVKMAKDLKKQERSKVEQQSKCQMKLRKSGRRKGRKPRSIKHGQVGTYKDADSKHETIEEKRAKWRERYYKKKALGTLKYQKFLSPRLPPDRKCTECGMVLRTYRSLVQHRNSAHNISYSEEDIERLQMRCTFPGCDFITARPVKMQYHRDTHETENQSENPVEFSCSFCEKKYKSKKELRNHSKCHTAVIKNCEICDKPLKGYYYSVHMNTVHNKDHVWQCHLCDYRVRGRELWFKYHLITKHNDTSRGLVEIFRCQYCNYTAPKKQNVARHTRVRHEIALGLRPKEAICDICGKEFGEKGLMVAHRARHTDPERFKCSFCTYRSPDYRSFETHVRTQHTQKDVRPWKCDLCSHAAKEKGNLKKHFRSKHKMSDKEATGRMKTIKPDTTAPIYVPLSEYKDPENNSSLPPPPRHRVTPKFKSLQSEQFMPQMEESFVDNAGDFKEQSGSIKKSSDMEIDPVQYKALEPMSRVGDESVRNIDDASRQAMSSTVAAVLQAAENTQQPSLHTLAAAAMMPQSMHPTMSMYAGLPQIHSNGLPSQVNDGNTLPTASCFFGPQPTLPQPTAQSDLHIQNQSQPQQQQQTMLHPGQQQQQSQHYSMPVKYENAHHAQAYLEKYENNQNQHNFPQV